MKTKEWNGEGQTVSYKDVYESLSETQVNMRTAAKELKNQRDEIIHRAEQLKLAKSSTYHNEMGKLIKRLFGVDYNCQREGKFDHE